MGIMNEPEYNRRKELEEFDKTKLGVKGLIDAGISEVPRIFQHPPETLSDIDQFVTDDDVQTIVPVIDMSAPHDVVVNKIREAASTVGLFQVVNHGIPLALLHRMIKTSVAFHEQPPQEKMGWYDRNWNTNATGVGFFSNFELFYSRAASWRDTLQLRLHPPAINPDVIPDLCREEAMEWDKETKKLGLRLMEMLSEGLGLSPQKLSGEQYIGRTSLSLNYYPYCPEPNKTIGITGHTDPGMLTILLQDHEIGGLQLKCNGEWIKINPIDGALVVNLGDLFQIISNDEYKSGGHRVLANSFKEPRISVAVFLSPGKADDLYGPLPELVSEEKPALYKQFKFSEFCSRFLHKEIGYNSMNNMFRI